MNNKLLAFIKKETVLTAAFVLSVISACIVPPDKKYISYINWNTLLLLYSLMAVMAGLQKLGLFRQIGSLLLSKTGRARPMTLVLVFLPFFFSMFITNDVALITFVPFAIIVLRMADQESLLVPVVVLQTIAANLGSMLTPMGNPQNLYLYGISGMSPLAFIRLLLPHTAVAAAFLFISSLLIKNTPVKALPAENISENSLDGKLCICYVTGFLICLLCVAKLLPPLVAAAAITIFLTLRDRSIFKKIDYPLLGTFALLFIFIGNIGRIDIFCNFLESAIEGNEKLVAVLASQVISNVPAALLLSEFTKNWPALIVGANLGGLGTLIASMASLISYKQITAQYPEKKGKYFILFTVTNFLLLGILFLIP